MSVVGWLKFQCQVNYPWLGQSPTGWTAQLFLIFRMCKVPRSTALHHEYFSSSFFFYFYSNHFQKKQGLSWALKKASDVETMCAYRAPNGLTLMLLSVGPIDIRGWMGLRGGGCPVNCMMVGKRHQEHLRVVTTTKASTHQVDTGIPRGGGESMRCDWLHMDLNVIPVNLNFIL